MKSAHWVLVALLASGAAYAGSLHILAADASFGPISGTDASDKQVGQGGDYQGVYGIKLYEDADFPCKAKVLSRHVNTSSQKSGSFTSSGCGSPGSEKVAQFTNVDTYVRGIQICQRGSGSHKEFVKGVRLFGAKLNRSTGQLTNVSGNKEIERTNCKEWKPAKYCPVGKVASKIDIQYKMNTAGPDYFVGARLVCRSVVKK